MAIYIAKKQQSAPVLDGDATTADVAPGKTFYSDSTTKQTGAMPVYNGASYVLHPGTSQSFSAGRYIAGNISCTAPFLSGNAAESDVLSGKTFYVSDLKLTGTMTNKGAWTSTGNKANASTTKNITVPAGYHNGSGYVQLASLSSQTGVDSGKTAIDASHVVSGYQGWVNGSKVSGTYDLPSGTKDDTGTPITTNGDHTITGLSSYEGVKVNVNVPTPVPTLDGDAVAGNVLSGKTFYSDSTTKLTGTMTNRGHVVQSYLPCGNIFTIPEGYHDGTGYVQASPLSTQTRVESGKTAIDASHVLDGYQGWVNGTRITGTYSPTATETLLWQNSNTSTSLGNTTITLSESLRDSGGNPKFDYLKIVTQHNPPNYLMEDIALKPFPEFFDCVNSGNNSNRRAFEIYDAEANWRYVFYISDTQISFTGKNGSTTKTNRGIPYKIYGVKYN